MDNPIRPKRLVSFIIVAIIAFCVGYVIQPYYAKWNSSIHNNAPVGSQFIPVTVVTDTENASTSPSLSIEYPQFPSLSQEWNVAIASSVTQRLEQFKKDVKENAAARAATSRESAGGSSAGSNSAEIPMNSYTFIVAWEPVQINEHYVSFIVRYSMYNGGAHGIDELQTFNYDVAAARTVTLDDLFAGQKDYLKTISNQVRSQLSASLRSASPGYDPEPALDEGTAPTAENFSNFTFNNYAVTFYFPRYAVAPGAFGEQKALISR